MGVLGAIFERILKSCWLELYTQWPQLNAIGVYFLDTKNELEREREREREVISYVVSGPDEQQLSTSKINGCPPLLIQAFQGSQIQNKHESECSGSIFTWSFTVVKIIVIWTNICKNDPIYLS